ncbi:MAG: hypothetical protein IT579_16245 [Verrucomicrobia subdivision 3 bacterium]|nr:hypothetical protein [Limisphaerales bacterium]
MNTKLKTGAWVIVALGIGALLLLQQLQIKRLVAECAALRTQLNETASLQESNAQLAAQLKAIEETSQADRTELMRLRGQGVRLRQLEQENTQLKAQGKQLTQRLREVQSAAATTALPTVIPASDVKVTMKTTTLAPPANETDLGSIEFADGIAVRFDLGGGTNCVVTPKILSDGNAQMQISVEVTNADGTASLLGQSYLTARPGQHCSISVGDRMIALAPKLKTQ